jgi:hypothetical protein
VQTIEKEKNEYLEKSSKEKEDDLGIF